jgi:hypothetical protein
MERKLETAGAVTGMYKYLRHGMYLRKVLRLLGMHVGTNDR